MKFNLSDRSQGVGEDFVKNTVLYKTSLAIKEEILKHKWIESEKVGRDIGFDLAMMDWVCRYKTQWAKEQSAAQTKREKGEKMDKSGKVVEVVEQN